jgi:hypothetical protein
VSIAPEPLDCGLQAGLRADDRVGRQVLGDERGLLEEQRQVVLDAGCRHALRDVLVGAAAGGVPLERLAKFAAEPRLAFLVQRELARRQQPHLAHLVNRALAVHVEAADALHHFVVELDTVGDRAAHGKEIDQSAAHAVFAGRHHLGHVGVAGGDELGAQGTGRESRALLEKKRAGGEVLDRREAVERGGDRDDNRVEIALHQLVERGEPARNQVLVRRELVVGQRFPVGEEVDLEALLKERDFLEQPLCLLGSCSKDGERPPRARELREQEGIGGAVERRRTYAAPRLRQFDLQPVERF